MWDGILWSRAPGVRAVSPQQLGNLIQGSLTSQAYNPRFWSPPCLCNEIVQTGLMLMRKKLIAANWKMYKTPEQTAAFFREFPSPGRRSRRGTTSWSARPLSILQTAVDAAWGSNVAIGAQNVHWEKEGAFTGEISAPMLTALRRHPRDHRALRAPPVLQRDRRHGEPQAGDCAGDRTDADRVRRRGAGGTRGRTDGRRVAPPMHAGVQWHLRAQGGQADRRLRAGLGHRHGQDRDSADGGGCALRHSARGRQDLWR